MPFFSMVGTSNKSDPESWPLSLGIPIFFLAKSPWSTRYNTRAGFLPYDTAVLYEMEMVSITRGGLGRFHRLLDRESARNLKVWNSSSRDGLDMFNIRIEMCVFVRNGVFKVSHNQGFPDVIPTAKEESSVFLVVSNASRNRSEDSQ